MAMGMSYTEFWDEPPFLATVYRKAYRLEREVANEQAWLNGLYVYDAVAVCLANVFRKSGTKAQNYLERPIDLFPLTEEEKKRREQEEFEKLQKGFEAMRLRQQISKKQKGE